MTSNVFLDIEVRGLSNDPPTPLMYTENRTNMIVSKASDYNLAVVRFSLSNSLIPIFTMPIRTVSDQLLNPPPISSGIVAPSPNYTIYTVTLTHNGTIVEFPIVFDPTISTGVVPPPEIVNGTYVQDSTYYYVFTPQHMVLMVNTALQGAFNLLTPPVGSLAPRFSFDPATQLFRFTAQRQFYINTLPNATRIDVFISEALSERCFNTMPAIFQNLSQGRDFQLDINDVFENYVNPANVVPVSPPDYIYISTSSSNVSRWFDIQSIFFTTNTIPILPEFITSQTSAGDNIRTPILTDFVPDMTMFGDESGQIIYNPQASIEYRLIDLTAGTPLRRIDLQGFWRDRSNRVHPITLPIGAAFNIKLVFVKKSFSDVL